MINISELSVGDIFSETSHYKLENLKSGVIYLKHIESGNIVTLSNEYIENLLTSADQYNNEVKVGKEDKFWTAQQLAGALNNGLLPKDTTIRVGDIRVEGIRTIWENIHDTRVFSVCFLTQTKDKPKKQLQAEREAQIKEALLAIDVAQKSKKGVANAATVALRTIQENPISEYEEGHQRELRGYKVQFVSRDGRYNCIDLDINEEHNVRPVNINTIKWLVVNGIKYIVE